MAAIMTFSGLAFDPIRPDPESISMIDIVAAMPHINRFNGHTIFPYSIATHSVCLYEYGLAKGHDSYDDLAWALLHDAPEIYIGDLCTPIKREMPDFKAIDENIMGQICIKYRMSMEMPDWLKDADRRICLDERNVLFPAIPWGWGDLEDMDPLGIEIPTWGVDEARDAFAQRLKIVFGADGPAK